MELHWDETQEEKKLRVDEILLKNSQPVLTCITCLELITDRQTAVTTEHGTYHGPPMTCVEGRQETPWWQK
jgi:hypothetical protein